MTQLLENLSQVQISFILSIFAIVFSVLLSVRMAVLNRQLCNERDQLEKRLRIMTSGAVGMGEKLVQLESRLTDAINGQLQAAEGDAQLSYSHALKLIEKGVDHSVIMSHSGLSESELNLMELLHQSLSEDKRLREEV